MSEFCEHRENLKSATAQGLERVLHLSAEALRALHEDEADRLVHVDGELASAFAVKERALAALQEHLAQHGCGFDHSKSRSV